MSFLYYSHFKAILLYSFNSGKGWAWIRI